MFWLIQLKEGLTGDELWSPAKQSLRQLLLGKWFIWECDPREQKGQGRWNEGEKANSRMRELPTWWCVVNSARLSREP